MKMDDFSAIFELIFTQFFLLVRCDHTEFVEINVGQVFFTDETVNNLQVGFEQITKNFVKPKKHCISHRQNSVKSTFSQINQSKSISRKICEFLQNVLTF